MTEYQMNRLIAVLEEAVVELRRIAESAEHTENMERDERGYNRR